MTPSELCWHGKTSFTRWFQWNPTTFPTPQFMMPESLNSLHPELRSKCLCSMEVCDRMLPMIKGGVRSPSSQSNNHRRLFMNNEISLLGLKDVIDITRMSKSTIYRKMNTGDFPRSLDLGGNCRRWLLKDIQQWVNSLK